MKLNYIPICIVCFQRKVELRRSQELRDTPEYRKNNENAGKYEVAIIRDSNMYNRYNAYILHSKESAWHQGQLKEYYEKTGYKSYYIQHLYNSDHICINHHSKHFPILHLHCMEAGLIIMLYVLKHFLISDHMRNKEEKNIH